MEQCSLCPSTAVTEVANGRQVIYLCKLHDTWTDDDILYAVGQSPCEDCGGVSTERQTRQGKHIDVCAECALEFARKELKAYQNNKTYNAIGNTVLSAIKDRKQ